MRLGNWIAVSIALVLLSLGTTEAQQPRRVALLIANATYAYAGQLKNPPNDARLVGESLKRAGFQTVDIKPNLSIAAFRTALRDFRAKAAGAQVALVYYAGHGIEANGRNWLIPVDAQLNSDLDLPDEAIDLDRVMDDVRGASLRVVILDACRNNPFGRSWRSGTRAVSRGLGGVDADDVLVIYAAAPGQTASDGTGANSPFATALARRLPQADLPIQLLGGQVRDDVLRATEKKQRPFVSASITGTPFYLVPKLSSSAQAAVAFSDDDSPFPFSMLGEWRLHREIQNECAPRLLIHRVTGGVLEFYSGKSTATRPDPDKFRVIILQTGDRLEVRSPAFWSFWSADFFEIKNKILTAKDGDRICQYRRAGV